MRRAAALLLALCVPAAALAQTPAALCPETANARERLDCLSRTVSEADSALDRALAGARAAIAADERTQPAQRTRWLRLLEESQGRFELWRNFECQSLAPYETRRSVRERGIGALEQRSLCLAERNRARSEDLAARYPPPAGWTYVPPAPPPTDAEPAPAPPNVRIIGPPK
ncbi:MAG TPA: lysozyme inhibitor LprI family protein [Xanthobacteraceae bacterium]|nr:lysozyme inhibitor LprI family protein [Xanthobacteraceae bacterium]